MFVAESLDKVPACQVGAKKGHSEVEKRPRTHDVTRQISDFGVNFQIMEHFVSMASDSAINCQGAEAQVLCTLGEHRRERA